MIAILAFIIGIDVGYLFYPKDHPCKPAPVRTEGCTIPPLPRDGKPYWIVLSLTQLDVSGSTYTDNADIPGKQITAFYACKVTP